LLEAARLGVEPAQGALPVDVAMRHPDRVPAGDRHGRRTQEGGDRDRIARDSPRVLIEAQQGGSGESVAAGPALARDPCGAVSQATDTGAVITGIVVTPCPPGLACLSLLAGRSPATSRSSRRLVRAPKLCSVAAYFTPRSFQKKRTWFAK
jgi:hypothetical protein